MAIFGFKKRKDEKLEQNAEATKSNVDKKSLQKATSKKYTKNLKSIVLLKRFLKLNIFNSRAF